MGTSTLKLYTCSTPNGFKASTALEELGLPYDVVKVDLLKAEQKSDWYLELCPNGKIPTLCDDNVVISQSGAILQYLVEKYDTEHKISFSPGSKEYYKCLQWMYWQQGELGPSVGGANHFRWLATVRSDYALERHMKALEQLLEVLDQQLNSTAFLAGERYSIADIATYCLVSHLRFHHVDFSQYPAVARWLNIIEQRPAVLRGKKIPDADHTDDRLAEQLSKLEKAVQARTT